MISEKNILIVSKSSQPGGLEFHVLDLIKVFSKANKVYLIVPSGPLVEEYRKYGANVIEFTPKSPLDFEYINFIKRFCVDNRIHILHAHELISCQAVYACYIARVPKRVYHVHTPFLYWKHKNLLIKIIKSIPNWVANFITANFLSTDVICLTPMIRIHRIFFELIIPSKLKVIHNSVDVERFSTSPSFEQITDMRRIMGIPRDKVVIGTIARLSYEKGHLVLIKAFEIINKEFPNKYHLLLAGGGDLEQYYTDYCEEHVTGCYSITGKFNEQDKIKIIHSINYAVVPSYAEGFGYVLTEFMASKIPVLSSNLPVLKYVGGLGVWFFKKGNHKDLYSRLKEVLTMSDKMVNERITMAHQKVQDYSIEQFAKNYSSVYQGKII